jgi:hypothetical protein
MVRSIAVAPDAIAGLEAWYKIDTVSGNDGDLITTWSDSSGNSRDLTRSVDDARRPSYQTNEVNGLACLRFGGTDDQMTSTVFAVAQPLTAVMVVKQVGWINGEWLFDSDAVGEMGVFQSTTSPRVDLWGGSSAVAANTGLVVGEWHILVAIFEGASSSLRVDGGTATTGSGGTVGLNGFTLGAKANDTVWSQIDVAEIAFYSASLSEANQDALLAHLGSKYAITVA